MKVLNSISLPEVFHKVTSYITAKSSEWAGYAVTKIKSALPYLEDPRIAGTAIFVVNFGILELAFRISQVVGLLCFSKETVSQKNIKSVFEMTLAGGLVVAGNVAFARATNISLHPLVISALVVASFITKYLLETCLEPQEQPIFVDKI